MSSAELKCVSVRSVTAIDAHVGARLRQQRRVKQMSLERLAQLLGVTCQQVQKYEKGTNRIGASRLFDAATILGVSVQYFFDGLEDLKPEIGALADEPLSKS